MRSVHHLWAYNPHLKNSHFLPDFYLWGWISSLAFSKFALEFLMYFSLEFASLTVYGFSSQCLMKMRNRTYLTFLY